MSSSTSTRPVTTDGHAEAEDNPGREREPGTEQPAGARRFLLKADEPRGALYVALRHAAVLSLLTFASIWGLLAREGLVALNTYAGMSVEPTIWAQAVGCLVMGWNVANRESLERWYAPAFIAIGTGFCGSVTTFSSWVLHVFQAYGDQNHYDRHGLHNVMDALTQTFVTLGMSIVSLHAGMALKTVLPAEPVLYQLERITTHRKARRRLAAATADNGKSVSSTADATVNADTHLPYAVVPDLISVALGVVFWAGAAILCGTYAPFRHVTYAVVLSPPGAILRWYLSRLNSIQGSKQFPYWPLGTLAANLIATAVLAGVFVAQRVGRVTGAQGLGASSVDGCNALYGVQEGFCGCLSTISTFAVELTNLKPKRRAVGYAVGSYVIGIILCVLIIGSPWWSVGMDGSCKGITV